MKVLARSRYGAAKNCSGWARSDRQRPAAGAVAADHSFRNRPTIIDCAITRVGKAAAAARRAKAEPCPPSSIEQQWWARREARASTLRLLARPLDRNTLDDLFRQFFKLRYEAALPIFTLGDVREGLSVGDLGGVRLFADAAVPIDPLKVVLSSCAAATEQPRLRQAATANEMGDLLSKAVTLIACSPTYPSPPSARRRRS